MAEIIVSTGEMDAFSDRLNAYKRSVDRQRELIKKVQRSSVVRNLPSNIETRLRRAADKAEDHSRRLTQMDTSLHSVIFEYERTERSLYKALSAGVEIGVCGASVAIGGFTIAIPEAYIEQWNELKDKLRDNAADIIGIGKWTSIASVVSMGEIGHWGNGKVEKIEDGYTLYEKRASYSNVGDTLFYAQDEHGFMRVDTNLINSYAEMKLTTGTACIAAGATYTAARINGEYTTDLGTTKTSVDIGVIDADAQIKMDLSSGDLYAKGDVGVFLGKADISHTGTVSDIDYSLGGSIEVGVGAHIEAGLNDGVFTFDGGLAFGVGGSVKFSVDLKDVGAKVGDLFGGLF